MPTTQSVLITPAVSTSAVEPPKRAGSASSQ